MSFKEHALALEAIGRGHLANGQFSEAQQSLSKALEFDSELGSAAVALIEVYRGLEQPHSALDACQRAISVIKDDPGLRLYLAWLHFELGNYSQAEFEARALLTIAPHLRLEAYRSLAFSTSAAGDWVKAGEVLTQIESAFPTAVGGISEEVASTFAGYLYKAVADGDDTGAMARWAQLPTQIACCPAFNLPERQSFLAACHFRQKSFCAGLELFKSSIGTLGAPENSDKNDVVIVTSLMPARIADQKRALESWRTLGFRIISVNDPNEISVLAPQFPEVQFIAAARTAESELRRPLIYVDDLLSAANAAPEALVGIVNSDILLQPSSFDFVKMVTFATRTSLVLGHRIDIERPLRDLDGPIYRQGFDWFFFRKAIIGHALQSSLVFGAPWWDLWIPISCILSGIELITFKTPVAFHAKHNIAWSEADFDAMGRHFVQAIIKKSKECTPRTVVATALSGVCEAMDHLGVVNEIEGDVVVSLSQNVSSIIQAAMVVVSSVTWNQSRC